MDFEFSEDQTQLRTQVRRFLEGESALKSTRAILDGAGAFDRDLWQGLADLGCMAAAIPERYGGIGAGYLELCVIAEELGRTLAAVPFSSSIFLAAEFLMEAGSGAQKEAYLGKLASGKLIGTFAFAESVGSPSPDTLTTTVSNGRLTGTKALVPDGDVADFAVVAARTAADRELLGISLFLVDLRGAGVTRAPVDTIDPTRSHARLVFTNAPAEPLGPAGDGWRVVTNVFDRAAILCAFEQLGGAERALDIARDYAFERMAFGRPIGSFQAIKHLLADMYVSMTLARSNCYYGAWALSTRAQELGVAAATARVSATQAFQHCARNNIQVHGGMGFTWEADCHLYYRRSNLLALTLGPPSYWEDLLIARLRKDQRS